MAKKRRVSKASRLKMAAAQHERWATYRAAKEAKANGKPAPGQIHVPQSIMDRVYTPLEVTPTPPRVVDLNATWKNAYQEGWQDAVKTLNLN